MDTRCLPLRILARPALSSAVSNPYTKLLYAPLMAAGHHVVEYRLDRAVLEPWDVVHVHWPESVFNHTLPEALITTESLLLGLSRARARGARVLWTVHNLRAHERRHPSWEARFRKRFFKLVDGIVGLSASGLEAACETYPELTSLPRWVVPHPHYRGRYPDTVTRAEAREALGLPAAGPVLLSFGRVFAYKNIPALLRAAAAAPNEPWTIMIAGKPRDAAIEHDLRQAAKLDSRIQLHLDFIPQDRVQLYFRAATLTVLPYREILNSGTALLSLSFDRPVLLPARGAGAELQQRPGAPWVNIFEDELNVADLKRSIGAVSQAPERTDGSPVSFCAPEVVAADMLRVFQELSAR